MRNRVYGFAVRVSLVVLLSAGIAVGQQTTPSGTTDAAGASSTTTMTKGQLKAQKAQQKREEQSANASAKSAKAEAKAKKAQDKATLAQEKANGWRAVQPSGSVAPATPPSTSPQPPNF
jgi:hypothetical protein